MSGSSSGSPVAGPQVARLVERAGDEPVIAVDGAFGSSRGIELSHWPGHRTPADLRHDLSTGCALNFARLSPGERAERSGGATLAINNHYDTDGVLALWTVLHPERALELERPLLDAAAAGDFFWVPTREAFAFDALVSLLPDPIASPLPVGGMRDTARRSRALEFVLVHAADLLAEPLSGPTWAPFRAALAPALERLDADLAALSACERRDETARDLVHLVAGAAIAPGRHALFHTADRADRVLVSARVASGAWTHRLVVGTRSWFDLVSAPPPRRFDLAEAVRALAALEPPRDGAAWRAEDTASPSPELWFGHGDFQRFSEHNDRLAPSRLAPEVVREALLAAPLV